MIVTINLSTPRRKIEDIINNMIFEAKMKDFHIKKYNNILISSFILLMFKNHNANAEEILRSSLMSSSIVDELNLIGYPTVDAIYNLLIIRKHMEYTKR